DRMDADDDVGKGLPGFIKDAPFDRVRAFLRRWLCRFTFCRKRFRRLTGGGHGGSKQGQPEQAGEQHSARGSSVRARQRERRRHGCFSCARLLRSRTSVTSASVPSLTVTRLVTVTGRSSSSRAVDGVLYRSR